MTQCKVLGLFAMLAMLVLEGLTLKEDNGELVRIVAQTSLPLPTPRELAGSLFGLLASLPRLVLVSGWPLIAFAAAQLATLPGLLEGSVYQGDAAGSELPCATFLSSIPGAQFRRPIQYAGLAYGD